MAVTQPLPSKFYSSIKEYFNVKLNDKMFNVLCIWDKQNDHESKTKEIFQILLNQMNRLETWISSWHFGRVLRLRNNFHWIARNPVQMFND